MAGRTRLGLGLVLLLTTAGTALAGEPHWLGDAAPGGRDERRGANRDERYDRGGHMGDGAQRQARLWLRSGAGDEGACLQAPPASLTELLQVDPQGRVTELPRQSVGRQGLSFPLREEGLYTTYAIERAVDGQTLVLSVAKAEMSHFLHGGRRDRRAVAERIAPRTLAAAPFEIVRERLHGESFYSELRSGDELVFRVLLQGSPLPGARVRVVTGRGWEKTLVTDAAGRARVQMIRDYYPPWSAFQRQHRERLLLVAEHEVVADGVWGGQAYRRVRYQATLPASYLPSRSDYASTAIGLAIGLGALVFTGLAVYLYRRRRVRPFKEALVHG